MLENLEALALNNNNIVDILELSRLRKLKFINLSENIITNISVLSSLTTLECLYFKI